jgi:glycosyltransferase involved in cell wall biosynthesis
MPAPDECAQSQVLTIAFVGNLIRRKGLEELLEAIGRLSIDGYKLHLDIYGPGDISTYNLPSLATAYRGPIAFGDTQNVLAKYDALVVPSRYDGWAVVVNEALLAGIPVICSSSTGAKDLVERLGAGATYAREDPTALYHSIKRLIESPEVLRAMRLATSNAKDVIAPQVAADYIHAVFQAPPAQRRNIRAPWHLPPQQQPLS